MSTVQVNIRVLDKDYQVACPEAEREALLAAAKLLHDRMKAIRDGGKVVGVDRIAVMAALNMAHELLEYASGPDIEALNQRIHLIQDRIDDALSKAQQQQ